MSNNYFYHPFNPNKLKIETYNFNGWETIDSIIYEVDDINFTWEIELTKTKNLK